MVSWANRIYISFKLSFSLVVYKLNGEHLLESGGRPVCRTVAHQSLDDLILSLSLSLSLLLFFFFWIFDQMGSGLQRSLFGLGYDDVGHHFIFIFIFKKIILVLFLNFLFVNFFCFVWTLFLFLWVSIFDQNTALSIFFAQHNTNRCVGCFDDCRLYLYQLHSLFSFFSLSDQNLRIFYYYQRLYTTSLSISLSLSKYQKAICFDGLWIRKLEVFIMTKLALFLVHVIPRYGLF